MMWPDERRRGRFAVSSGHTYVAGVALGARQQLDVADDLAAVLLGKRRHGMGLGVGVWDARRNDQGRELTPIALVEIDQGDSFACRHGALVLVVVPGQTSASLFISARAATRPDTPSPRTATGRP